jgi:osmotically inducible lipoprotein OsmB
MKTLTQTFRCTMSIATIVALSACSSMSTHSQNTVVGASVGAVAGAVLTGGSPVGTVGGAVVGGVIGDHIKR